MGQDFTMFVRFSGAVLVAMLSLLPGETKAFPGDGAQGIGLEGFTPGGVVPPYEPIRASREGNNWVLQPDPTTPNNCLGWIEGPRVDLLPAADALGGNQLLLRMTYSFTAPTDNCPAVRLRVNSANWTRNAMTELGPPLFREQRRQGWGTAVVALDRSGITSPTTARVFVDLYGAGPAGSVDPGFTFRVEGIEALSTVSGASVARSLLLSIVYREDDGNVYAHLGGDAVNRRLLRARAERFVYDGAWCAVIDEGRLYGYSGLANLAELLIDEGRVASVSISDHHLMYLLENGDLKVFDFLTGIRTTVRQDSGMWACNASGDGTLTAMQLDDDKIRVWQYDTRSANPSLILLSNDYRIVNLFNRDMGFPLDW